ncbi:hypothetical protein QTN25_007466 [Entamoeba marina]
MKLEKNIKHIDTLQTVIIDARKCSNKYILQSVNLFDTTRTKVILLCGELNEIFSKNNTIIGCAHGNAEVTPMLMKDYIPIKTSVDREPNHSILRNWFSDRYNSNDTVWYYRYDVDSFRDIERLKLIYEHTLPDTLVIDLTNKKYAKKIQPKQIDLINPNGVNVLQHIALIGYANQKSIDVSLPSSVERVDVYCNGFNITTPESIKELYLESPNSIPKNLVNFFDLSHMNDLKNCVIRIIDGKVTLPKHKFKTIDMSLFGDSTFNALSTEKLTIHSSPMLQPLEKSSFNELAIYSCPDFDNIDLLKHSSLTNLYIFSSPLPKTLPTSLLNLTFTPSYDDSKKIPQHISTLTNIQSLNIPYLNLEPIQQLSNKNYSGISLSCLTNLVNAHLFIPADMFKLSPSITNLSLNFNKKITKKIHLDYLTNLQILNISPVQSTVTFPTSLTNLCLSSNSRTPLPLSDIQVKYLAYGCNSLVSPTQLQLPTSLESLCLNVTTEEGICFPVLSSLTQLTQLSIQVGFGFYRGGKQKEIKLCSLSLPSSLKELTTRTKPYKIVFNNIEETQLPNDVKNTYHN